MSWQSELAQCPSETAIRRRPTGSLWDSRPSEYCGEAACCLGWRVVMMLRYSTYMIRRQQIEPLTGEAYHAMHTAHCTLLHGAPPVG